ncbi:ribosome maturation factor RimM [Geitlerinema sp. P-1104]|uniref:ribosome maturation factor RimM n=1 Tax=Geitlerinema sp. P-1104 TaxID=2546230 RepID=UPI001476C405|nr:ribosome maturation factor RimM [Geitlerinema sp. P-1104]NMG59309.1 ribosome maturation factor RimM [Geitlerinema sp. P-1104]
MVEPQQEQVWLEIGRIVAPQGVRGAMRVYPNSDFPERFLEPGQRWLRRKGDLHPDLVELVSGRDLPGKGLYVIELEGIRTREAAESLRDAVLLVPEGDRLPLESGEFHVQDLLGLEVFHHQTGQRLGVTVDVFSAGNDLLQVQLDEALLPQKQENVKSKGGKKRQKPPSPPTVFIPFVEAIVPVVDLEQQRLEIDPPMGLLDIIN